MDVGKLLDDLRSAGLIKGERGSRKEFTPLGREIATKVGVSDPSLYSLRTVFDYYKNNQNQKQNLNQNQSPSQSPSQNQNQNGGNSAMSVSNVKPQTFSAVEIEKRLSERMDARFDQFGEIMRRSLEEIVTKLGNGTAPAAAEKSTPSMTRVTVPAQKIQVDWDLIVSKLLAPIIANGNFRSAALEPQELRDAALAMYSQPGLEVNFDLVYDRRVGGGDKLRSAPRFGGSDGREFVCTRERRDFTVGGLAPTAYRFFYNKKRK